MATDVLSVLRKQLSEAEDQVRRLVTAIAALEGAGLRLGGWRGRPRKAVSGGETRRGRNRTSERPLKAAGTVAGNGRTKRTFSAAMRAKVPASQS